MQRPKPRRPRLAAWAIRNAAVTVAVSRHTRDLALSRGGDPGRLHVVPPGVESPRLYNLYSGGAILPNDVNGIDATSDLLYGRQPIEIPVRA